MAESNEPPSETLPQRGKVEAVCRQWLVHEDGVKAYQMQNEEFDFHYGLNRKNRRTIREDIPVAKVVQSEEEKRLQEERYRELKILKAQAEQDAKVAQQVNMELEVQDIQRQKFQEVKDQEIALQLQEKEKKRYEKYLEKKKEKQLQKKRENLERELAQHTEEARLVLSTDSSNVVQLGSALGDLNLNSPRGTTANGHARVMPSGLIEDDGDFSDFYTVPDEVTNNPETRRVLQEQQDEELAKLLQDQEHKRTKAEVDRQKLKTIEARDEQLARIMQEQEKIKAKKAKQRRHQLREQQRQQQAATEAMAAGMNMSDACAAADPVQSNGEAAGGHRYRRDSYTRSISNTQRIQDPGPVHHQAIARHTSSPPSLPPREPPSYEMHKRIQSQNARVLGRHPPADMAPDEIGEVERWLAGTSPHHVPSNSHRRISDDHMPPSPSPPGSYHSEDEERSFSPDRSAGSGHAVSAPLQFNIAAAIDPTYRRRQHEIQDLDNTEVKTQIPLSQSLPLTDDMDVEWDPGLRGSLRRPKPHWNPMSRHYQDSTGTSSTLGRMEEEPGPDGPVMSPWQPVQGQKRSTLDKQRKSKKSSPNPPLAKRDSKGSCKQQ